MYYPHRFTTSGSETQGIKEHATAMMAHEFAIYADALGAGPFILGQKMSAVDIYAAMLCSWAPSMEDLFAKHPNLKAMYDAVLAVPAIKAVWERNGV